MRKLLVIETSSRGETSVSRQMMKRFLHHWSAANPGGEAVVRDLTSTSLEFTTASWLQAYFTPPEHQTSAMKDALSLSDALVAEVLAADEIAISTPVYNYNVPAVLKAWIDHIVRKGITLGADGSGLLKGKRATVLIASGGFYGEGSPIADRDIASRYLRLILNVMGIDDVTVVAGGGAKAVDLGETSMDDFVGSHGAAIKSAAA